ncbi:MAG: RnfABCDGE type electron transport complex subunit D [Abitibacteriaceae bacterium]|nr:RnfABCDGE type electron transport complex subunit D [Abditibacteriaceae bacterium]
MPEQTLSAPPTSAPSAPDAPPLVPPEVLEAERAVPAAADSKANSGLGWEPAPKPGTAARGGFDARYIAPIFITLILLVGQFSFGVLESLPQTLLAIAASMVTEIVLSRLMTGKWPHLASAYVSGISVGILIRSPYFWPYALCSMIAIASKYVIRVKGRHIWNPSNFAIVMMLWIAWDQVATLSQQWDNRFWAMAIIWTVGSLIIWRLKRFHICATYVVSFLAFGLVRSLIEHQYYVTEISPITGPMYQLFIFFMITDPKTTVRPKWGQCAVAFTIAAVEAVLRLNSNIHLSVHAPYYALFIVGPIANLIEIWYTSRRNRPSSDSPVPVVATA